MSDEPTQDEGLFPEEERPVLPRRRRKYSAELDITPMIDIVFLLLIFFLVATVPDLQTKVELPSARHGEGVNPRTSVIFTIADTGGGRAAVYLGDAKVGSALPKDPARRNAAIRRALHGEGALRLPDDPDEQAAAVHAAVELGAAELGYDAEGKLKVLLKGEGSVDHHEAARVTAAAHAANVERVECYYAVFEIR